MVHNRDLSTIIPWLFTDYFHVSLINLRIKRDLYTIIPWLFTDYLHVSLINLWILHEYVTKFGYLYLDFSLLHLWYFNGYTHQSVHTSNIAYAAYRVHVPLLIHLSFYLLFPSLVVRVNVQYPGRKLGQPLGVLCRILVRTT